MQTSLAGTRRAGGGAVTRLGRAARPPAASSPPRLLPPASYAAPLPQPAAWRPLPGRCCRRPCIQVAASKAAAAAAAASAGPAAQSGVSSWFKATGVPLLKVLQQLTLEQAALRSLGLILAAALGAVVGNKVLLLVGSKMEAVRERTEGSGGLQLLLGTALAAVYRPARVLLPYYAVSYILLVMSAFADVAVSALGPQLGSLPHFSCHQALNLLHGLTQLLQDLSEEVIIILVAWFAIRWKDQLIGVLTAKLEVDSTTDDLDLARVLVPLSNLLTWAIVAATVLVSLVSFGVNIQPLLAVGSIGTVAVGFATQSTMQNFVSALSIYTSRPFIVGDRVQLKSMSGSTIATGVVEHIMPMRTVLRGDNKVPIYIGNKDILNLMIVNESKLKRTSIPSKLPLVESRLTLRYTDMDRVAAVEAAITDYLNKLPVVDPAITPRCVLAEFTEAGPTLAIKVLLHKSVGGRQSFIQADILREAERIARSHGAFLSINQDYGGELPPSPILGLDAAAAPEM